MFSLITSTAIQAQLTTSPIFSNNMVLQRGQQLRTWGKANPGAAVHLSLHTQLSLAFANAQGEWEAVLGALPAGGPYQLVIQADGQTITYNNVMLGEVWICSGQSNMERSLKLSNNGTAESNSATWPNIRFFQMPKTLSTRPSNQIAAGSWAICTPTTARNFSGVGYFFGRDLHLSLNVPVGLISVTFGGTGIDTWISPTGLSVFPELTAALSELEQLSLPNLIDSITQLQSQWDQDLETQDLGLQQHWESTSYNWSGWPTMLLPKPWESDVLINRDGSVWFKLRFTLTASQASQDVQLSLGRIDDSDQTWINGQFVGSTALNPGLIRRYPVPANVLRTGENTITVRVRDYGFVGGMLGGATDMKIENGTWQVPLSGYWSFQVGTPTLGQRPLDLDPDDHPSLLYNGMVHPLSRLQIAGVIWYQGESNTGDPFRYRNKQVKIIDDWRSGWGIGDFPFITTQLAYFRPVAAEPAQSSWATLRESQFHTLKRGNTALVCLIDSGDAYDIHPSDKFTVGTRLAKAARKLVYQQNIVASGPSYYQFATVGNEIRITFRTYGSSLQSSNPNLRGFAIAGADGQFVWANARIINGQTVGVSHPSIPAPVYVRYAWSDNPGDLDLRNTDGLPAIPFRTDELPTPWE